MDRAEFVRRCDKDLATCESEVALHASECDLLGVIRWQMKIPQLREIKRFTGCAHDSDLEPFEKARVAIMAEVPNLEAVQNAFDEAFSCGLDAETQFKRALPESIALDVTIGDEVHVHGRSVLRRSSASLEAVRMHKEKLAQDGEKFFITTYRDVMRDELVIVERVLRNNIPLRMVFISGKAFEAWAHDRHRAYLAQGRKFSPGENLLSADDYDQLLSSEYAHACGHPNEVQLSEECKRLERMPGSSGVAMKVLHDMQMQEFAIKQEMRPSDPDRIAKLFARDLAAWPVKVGF